MAFHCPTCDKAFNTAEEGQLHWVSDEAQDEQHHKTPDCCKSFLTRNDRAAHMHDSSYHNICDHCTHDFRNQHDDYLFHRRLLSASMQVQLKTPDDLLNTHNISTHVSCAPCGRGFSSADALHDHWQLDYRHHFCRPCSKHFPDYNSLLYHYNDDESWVDGVTHGYCAACRQDYGNMDGVQWHWSESQQHAYCYTCKETFMTREELRDHFLGNKGVPGHSWCSLCQKPFPKPGDFEKHLWDNEQDHFCCYTCNLLFASPVDRTDHWAADPNHPYCVPCHQLYEDFDQLCLHRLKTHPGDPTLDHKKVMEWAETIYSKAKELPLMKPDDQNVGEHAHEDPEGFADEEMGDAEYGSYEGNYDDEDEGEDDEGEYDGVHEARNAPQIE
ncbi:hypothetical protein F5B19DRAFT_504219 [Rostrohypoxylon terebratum]|nr:hypothetical protein F5B19DRAFT_504219 [Rostrohypoxylon terebratum]